MLHKTRGIVIRYIRYRETSIIATIFTEEFGMRSYIINGIRSSKSKKSIAAFAPLTLLDLVVYQKDSSEIQRLSEWKRAVLQNDIYTNLKKSTVALFLSEILYKSIRESDPNPDLFDFVFHSIEWLDTAEEGLSDFHVQFLSKFTRYLGFGLDYYVDEGSIKVLQEMGSKRYGKIIGLSRKERVNNLERLLLFYKEHIEGFGTVKSLPVLQTVFDD